MTPLPGLSVIVPAYQAASLLPDTLGALRASTSPGLDWELIVVDDGSDDASAELAAPFADRVVRLAAPAGGPAGARNAGARVARGEWLFFVDADVRVHSDTLLRFRDSVLAHPDASAIFGAYDDTPAAPGMVSRYRNLLHRYVHLRGAGPAETFWGGLGGVRADLFRRLGGFDPGRYPRPQIEDIEFGYRLRDHHA
ncbi:MAG TPA: glycosyltransferase family 2 protein, partial [Gemmatimonadales bacterium]